MFRTFLVTCFAVLFFFGLATPAHAWDPCSDYVPLVPNEARIGPNVRCVGKPNNVNVQNLTGQCLALAVNGQQVSVTNPGTPATTPALQTTTSVTSVVPPGATVHLYLPNPVWTVSWMAFPCIVDTPVEFAPGVMLNGLPARLMNRFGADGNLIPVSSLGSGRATPTINGYDILSYTPAR